jgi:hypothetical protein
MTQFTKTQECSISAEINKRHYMSAFTINPYDAVVTPPKTLHKNARLWLPI